MIDAKLAAAARRYVTAHNRAATLQEERARFFCERAEPMGGGVDESPDAGGTIAFPQPTQERPCWKTWRDSGIGPIDEPDMERMPLSEWCSACVKREEIHREHRLAMRARGAALRAMSTIVRAGGPLA